MLKRINFKSVLIKYIISYFIILTVPISLITFFVYRNSASVLEKEIENSSLYKLSQVRDFIDARMHELNYIAISLDKDYMMRKSNFTESRYTITEGIDRLKMYRGDNSFIYEMLLYFRGSNEIYSSEGIYDLSVFTEQLYKFNTWKTQLFYDDLNNIKEVTIRPTETVKVNEINEYEVLSLIYPVPAFTETPHTSVLFLIKKTYLDNLMNNLLGDLQGSSYIFDDKMNVLVSMDENSFIPINEIITYLNVNKDSNIINATYEHNNYSIIRTNSIRTNWNYVIVIPTAQIFSKVLHIQNLILQIAVTALLLGAGLLIPLSYKNYSPILRIFKEISSHELNIENSKGIDELDKIHDTLKSVIHKNLSLENVIDLHKPLIREKLLEDLLHGKIHDKPSLENDLKSNQIIFQSSGFFVINVSIKHKTPKTDEQFISSYNITEMIKLHIDTNNIAYVVGPNHERIVSVIINVCPTAQSSEERLNISDTIRLCMEEQLHITPIMGVGKMYDCLAKINSSYIEASAALEYGLVRLSKPITTFDEIAEPHEQTYWYPVNEQLRFIQSLKQGDKIVALENMKHLVSIIHNHESSLILFKYVCFDIINMIAKTVNETKHHNLSQDISLLMGFSNYDDLEEKLTQFVVKYCDFVQNSEIEDKNNLKNSMLHLINNTFSDYNLSLESVSDKFNLPPYYVSRFFKENVQKTFSDYLAELRMNEAKRLLVSTNKTIDDVVRNIGYVDTKSFMRKFKSLEGITPGDYRKMYKVSFGKNSNV